MPKYINADEYIKYCEENWIVLNVDAVNEQPAADVEPVRHGYNVKWDYPSLFECSLCGWACDDTYPGDTATYKYCPNCGAKLDGEEDDA